MLERSQRNICVNPLVYCGIRCNDPSLKGSTLAGGKNSNSFVKGFARNVKGDCNIKERHCFLLTVSKDTLYRLNL